MSSEEVRKDRVCLGVAPECEFGRVEPLLSAIRGFLPVDFEPVGGAYLPDHIAGVIVLGDDGGGASHAGGGPVPKLLVAPRTGAATVRRSRDVELRALPSLDPCLRGRRMEDSDVVSFVPLAQETGDEIVGLMEGQPFWLRRGIGRTRTDLVALDLPAMAEGYRLFDYFQPGRFVRLLPLLEFIRTRTAEVDLDHGFFRACFVFDDPNLIRPRFGCLSFRELASHARAHGYHASIAMVPMDAAKAGNEAVEIFRANSAQLSLLIHGNDHTHLELLRCCSDSERHALLAEALRRIEVLEQRHGLVVDRVMEPPHGVVARAMFPAMAALGFESALTTFQHLLHFEPLEPWSRHLGMDISEVMPGGMATIPRIRMLPDWKTAVVLAGHHQDAAEGLEFLAELAQLVAGFGSVRWLSPSGIARSNFKVRRDGTRLWVKAYQRRVSVSIPDAVDQLIVERAWVASDESERLTVESQTDGHLFSAVQGRVSSALQVRAGDTVDIRSFFGQPLSAGEIRPPRWRPWPVARHFLTGTRDRLYPWLHPLAASIKRLSC